MVSKIHPIVKAHVLSSVKIEDKDTALELVDLCQTFGTVSIDVYRECVSLMMNKLELDRFKLCDVLSDKGVNPKFVLELCDFPF
jgi:hypothetical protein